MIPLYSTLGSYAGERSLARIQDLIELGRVTVQRDRKGNIKRAFLRQSDGSPALAKTIYVGTKYSYREHLPDGHTCHDLRRLDGSRSGKNYAPESVRPIFMAVLASVSV
jgi:hypothetical protein